MGIGIAGGAKQIPWNQGRVEPNYDALIKSAIGFAQVGDQSLIFGPKGATLVPKEVLGQLGQHSGGSPAPGPLDYSRIIAQAREVAPGNRVLLITGDDVQVPDSVYSYLQRELTGRNDMSPAQ